MKTRWEDEFRACLQVKLAELDGSSIDREEIAIEPLAEEAEQIELASLREMAVLALERKATLRREVAAALMRIADGSYGTCQECESPIAIIRLKAIPWARHCVTCQERLDRVTTQRGHSEMLIAA